ncbi:hypothetical protein QZH41_004564 [Actinostola sp. cb2023]|nr:hypothetical protein QZH41_004564 [Actinostola sp. cb2023]
MEWKCMEMGMENEQMQTTSQSEGRANARRLSTTRNVAAGAIGGMLSCVVGQPLDTIKVRLQVMATSVQPGQSPAFTGAIDCLQKMVKDGGLRSLYRGMLSPLLIATPVTALSFYSLSLGKRLQLDDPEQEPTMIQYMFAGAFCGVTCSFVVAPADRLKCLLQVNKTDCKGIPRGPLEVLKDIYRSEKIRGVYRGLAATMLREAIGSSVWYLTYEGLLKAMRPRGSTRDDVTMTSIVLSGGIAGTVFWILAFPIDNIKTRYQVAPVGLYPGGARDVLREVLRTEGPKGLYRGYLTAIIRAPLVHIALFLGYEFTLKTLNRFYP